MAEAAPGIVIDACARTDPGRVRPDNEDAFLIGDLDRGARWDGDGLFRCRPAPRGPLFVVCDGLGGAAAGEVASTLACETIWTEMHAAQATTDRAVYARLLRRALRKANRRLWETGRRHGKLRGMGTTVSAAGVIGDALILAQIGDSRAYILRGKSLVQVTRDQSVIAAMVHSGRLSLAEARALPDSHMILQALGVRRDVEVALSLVELRRGDRLLLCSDGVHGPIEHHLLAGLVGLRSDPAATADLLMEAALAAGGPDNATAVVAAFSGEGLALPAGADDLPRFTELDPMEDGERALANTSMVTRRLAARAGLLEDPGPPPIPATGQHPAIQDGALPARQRIAAALRARPALWALLGLFAAALALALWW